MVIGTMLMLSSIAVATLLSSWGPGPVWIRALVLSVVICLAALTQVACVYTWQNIVYEFNRMPAGVAFQLASQIANALNLAIPMMIVLSILAAIGRWRIGPPSLHPMQIRIVDVMMGIGVLAFLFAVNPEVQQRYNEIGLSEAKYNDVIATTGWLGNYVISRGDYPTVGQYRFETMMLATIVAPIAALGTIEDQTLRLTATVLSADGKQRLDRESTIPLGESPIEAAEQLAQQVADGLRADGAVELIEASR